MSYNGSGLFQINTSGQPVVAGTVITASAFNALTADLATGLTTAITKDGQTATTAQIPFAQGLRSTLVTDSTTSTSGSIITDGGLGVAKAITAGTTITGTKLIPTGTSVTGNGMYLPATNSVGISTAGVNAVYIDASQNVGVGVTPSAWGVSGILQLGRTALSGGANAVGSSLSWNAYYDTSWKYYNSLQAAQYTQSNGIHAWYNAPSGTAGNAITFTQAMTLDASGNLGVGTTSPSSYNSGYGSQTVIANAGGSAGATIVTSTSGNGSIYFADGSSGDTQYRGFVQYAHADDSLRFASAATERARIDSSGNLLVGTTSYGAPTGSSFQISPTYTLSGHGVGTPSGQGFAYYYYNANNIGSITQNGTTGVLYNLTSDYRLKNNQEALTGAKDFIMALKPKKWQWWDGSGEGVGFVAHEFMEVAKHSGHGEKDAVETIEIKDEDGNVTGTEERPVYQSIQPSSSEVMANLVSLIQEQQALITQLQADVAALKG
jgi:hypothetical protein